MKWLERLGIAAVYGFLFVPMIVLVSLSFNSAKHGAKWQGFTFDWYSRLLDNGSILDALSTSLEIAGSAALLSGLLGLCLGLNLEKRPDRALNQIAQVPSTLPDIMTGLSLLMYFVALGIPLGRISVILAHTSFGTAYVANLVRARVKALDPLLEDAAADLGAKPFEIFFKVTLPQLLPALVAGMLMTFTLSFDDFSIAFFTAGVGATTLPLKIYSMLKFGVTPEVNALSALILMASLIMVSISFWMQKKEVR